MIFFISLPRIFYSQSCDTLRIQVKGGFLEGTLCIPDAMQDSILTVFISGSGPTDRDGNSGHMKNNGLRMLADSLAKAGIASLRFDKRGIGESQIKDLAESTIRFENFSNDVITWTGYVDSLYRFKKKFIIGHSEGSLLGILACQTLECDGFISLAGAGRPIHEILGEQLRKQPFLDYDRVYSILDSLKLGHQVKVQDPALNMVFRGSVQPYLISWMAYDPASELTKLNCPTFIINGTSDIQVPVLDAERLHEKNPDSELRIIEKMNHVLKHSEEDYVSNMKTYMDPDLSLHPELTISIIEFIRRK